MHESRHIAKNVPLASMGGHVGCWTQNGPGKENCDERFFPNPMNRHHMPYSQTAYIWYIFAQLANNVSYADQDYAKLKLNYTLRTHFNNLRRNHRLRMQYELP